MNIEQHSGKLKRVHLGDTDKNKYSKHYHPGKLIKYHRKPASKRYHDGEIKMDALIHNIISVDI